MAVIAGLRNISSTGRRRICALGAPSLLVRIDGESGLDKMAPFLNVISNSSSSITPQQRHLSAQIVQSPNEQVSASPTSASLSEKRDVSFTGHPIGFFLNTHQVVKKLQNNGFTTDQAEATAEILMQIVLAQSETQFKYCVSKEQLEISVQQLLAQIDSIKKDMLILEKSQFAHLRHDLDKLSLGIKQLDSKLMDEVTKVKGGFALDMNLEKSRATEDDHKLQSEIQALTNRIGLEVANMRADIANLRANFEGSRTDIIKYVARTATGTIISVCTIGFLIYRFIS